MNPVRYAIARAAKQTEDPALVRLVKGWSKPEAPSSMSSASEIVRQSAGEVVTPPAPRKTRGPGKPFTLTDYQKRYAGETTPVLDTPSAKAEREWEAREFAEAEAEAAMRRRARLLAYDQELKGIVQGGKEACEKSA